MTLSPAALIVAALVLAAWHLVVTLGPLVADWCARRRHRPPRENPPKPFDP